MIHKRMILPQTVKFHSISLFFEWLNKAVLSYLLFSIKKIKLNFYRYLPILFAVILII